MSDAELHVLAVERLQAAGWVVVPATARDRAAPAVVERAHRSVAPWVSSFSRLSNADETTWFLAAEDYTDATDDGFTWNELETLSHDASSTDDEHAAVTAFWAEHLPILLSVRGSYAYLAVRRDGVVVHGEEPELEETTVVAPDLATLLESIVHAPAPGTGLVGALLLGT